MATNAQFYSNEKFHLSEKLSKESVRCACLVPCKRVRYEPNLSYAQLSQRNVERLIITSPEQKTELQSRFLNATEMSQRVVKETADKDNQTVTTLLECMRLLVDTLEQSKDAISDLNKFAEQQKAPNLLSQEIIEVMKLFHNRKLEILNRYMYVPRFS